MRDNVISFRFTDAEVQALEALQTPEDKSASQTAARLLRGMLAGRIDESTMSTSSTTVDNIEDLIDERLKIGLAEMRSQLAAQLAAQLEELRGKLKAR
jgi:hypothetical protein